MKKKNISKKLSLNKVTISGLNGRAMNAALGGRIPIEESVRICMITEPYCKPTEVNCTQYPECYSQKVDTCYFECTFTCHSFYTDCHEI